MQIETVSYNVNWGKMHVGYSFFVPCIDTRRAKKIIRETAKRLRIQLAFKVVVEEGIKGLRVWRV